MSTGTRSSPWVYLIIILLSCIPVFYNWGNLAIGGDMMIPFDSRSLEKYLYQWVDVQNGSYFALNFFPYYLLYRVFDFFHLSIYAISSILLFSINFLGGLGMYRLCRLFYDNEKSLLYIVPVALFLLSPAHFNAWQYLSIYSTIPWILYFIFKILIKKKIEITDLIWFSVIIFFASLELPNPKYLFYIFLTTLISFVAGFLLKIIDFKFFKKNYAKVVILGLLSVYLLLPQMYFSVTYSPENYGIHVKEGYDDTGKMMGHGVTTIANMLRAYHDNLVLQPVDTDRYRGSKFVIFGSYFLILILFSALLSMKESRYRKEEAVLYILAVTFLFLSASSNPPFGSVYEYLVVHFSSLGFLRTSAGANFFLSAFYTILVFLFLSRNKFQKLMVSLLLFGAIGLGYPIVNGDYFKNYNSINQYTNRSESGIRIPDDYFNIRDYINSQRVEARTFHPRAQLSYLNLNWGYFGPVLYNFLYDNYNIGYEKIDTNEKNYNIGFVFTDKTSIDSEHWKTKLSTSVIRSNESIDFSAVVTDEFYPRIILAEQGGATGIEFKKIDPTKYRVRLHGSKDNINLTLNEGFHAGWQLYLINGDDRDLSADLGKYRILDNNDHFQATREQLQNFIEDGLISDLGDGKEKIIRHDKWGSDRSQLDYIEKYSIGFISKESHGSIQNDNLPEGTFFETWLPNMLRLGELGLSESVIGSRVMELSSEHRPVFRGTANGWEIDVSEVCSRNKDFCTKNLDGTYDLEVVIEFWPQRIFLISAFVSGAVMMLCIGYAGIHVFRKRSKGSEHDRIADIC
jgi:hypothetical protein